MEADDQSSDDEVFCGEISDRERGCPIFNSRRRTTLYFPGISRPDANVNVFEQVTDDGILIFSCEEREQMDKEHCATIISEAEEAPVGAQPSDSFGAGGDNVEQTKAPRPTLSLASCDARRIDDNLLLTSVSNVGSLEENDTDSGYGSVVDASLTRSSSSYSLLSQTSPSSFSLSMREKSVLDERKRKYCQMSTSDTATVLFQSPCLSDSQLTRQSQSSGTSVDRGSFTSSPVVKRHIACVGTPSPASAREIVGKINHLQNNETETGALSRIKQKPQKSGFAGKSKIAAITKDFPVNETKICDSDVHMTLTDSTASDILHTGTPLKRKVVQKLSSSFDELENELTLWKKDDKVEHVAVETPSNDFTETRASAMLGETTASKKSTQNTYCISEQSPGLMAQLLSSPSVDGGDGDACIMKQPVPKESAILVPETPDVKTSFAASSKLRERHLRSSIQLSEENDCVPSSQRTDFELSNNFFSKSRQLAVAQAGEDSGCSCSTPVSSPLSRNFHLPSFLTKKCLSSPALVSSKLSSQTCETETACPIVNSAVSPTSANTVRPLSTSLQPISEDSTESDSESTELSDCITEKLRRLSPASGSKSFQKERTAKIPKHQPLKKSTPNAGNKENMEVERLPDFIFTSSMFAQTLLSADRSSCESNETAEGENASTCKDRCGIVEVTGLPPLGRQSQKMSFVPVEECYKNSSLSHCERPVPARTTPGNTHAGLTHISARSTQQQLEEESRAAMTRINTLINGETKHAMLDPQSSPALLTEFPPPKEATRVSWSDTLFEVPMTTVSPVQLATPRSILQQRPDHHEFPFSKDPPSPIILTRKRTPKWPRLFSFSS